MIHAKDDFKVAAVMVSIFNQNGKLIEEGQAVMQENKELDWLYKANYENPKHL